MDISIGTHSADVEAAAAHLAQCDAINRIWHGDYSLWKPDPTEISDRLGWLTVTELMSEQVPMLESFANKVREAGFRHIVLLGMGGSSLGAEVLRQTFGSSKGYPELVVLDSTLPACVQAVTETIDPRHTLFLASSKSGTTVETVSLLQYFLSMAQSAMGKERARKNFAIIQNLALINIVRHTWIGLRTNSTKIVAFFRTHGASILEGITKRILPPRILLQGKGIIPCNFGKITGY